MTVCTGSLGYLQQSILAHPAGTQPEGDRLHPDGFATTPGLVVLFA